MFDLMTWHFRERLAPEVDMGLCGWGRKDSPYFYVPFLMEELSVRGHFNPTAYNCAFKSENAEHLV